MDKRGLEQLKHGNTDPDKLARRETKAAHQRVQATVRRINNLSSKPTETSHIMDSMTESKSPWIKIETVEEGGGTVFARVKTFRDYEEGTESYRAEFVVGSTETKDFFEEDGVDLEGNQVYIHPSRQRDEPGANMNLPLLSSRINGTQAAEMLRRIETLNQSLDIIEPALDAIEEQRAVAA